MNEKENERRERKRKSTQRERTDYHGHLYSTNERTTLHCVIEPCKPFLVPTGLSGYIVRSSELQRSSNVFNISEISQSLSI